MKAVCFSQGVNFAEKALLYQRANIKTQNDKLKCKNLPYFCPLIFAFCFPEIATPSARNDTPFRHCEEVRHLTDDEAISERDSSFYSEQAPQSPKA